MYSRRMKNQIHVNLDKIIQLHNGTHKRNVYIILEVIKVEVSHAGEYQGPSMYLNALKSSKSIWAISL